MEDKENEYRNYLSSIQEQLNQRANNSEKEMDDRISEFYKKHGYDMLSFISGKNSDFMQSSEWSLNNVKK
ncbi:hypothetical protein S479_23715 [Salmonella enterica subsp. enterica serovar Newport]|nr:hypothetical protein [Salmonella enterica]EEK2703116.1 hypothetical protein [Salmonella enterica subsp. enterica serovar Newport]